MVHTNLVLGDNWLRGEWPEHVDVMHEGAGDSLRYVPERTCTFDIKDNMTESEGIGWTWVECSNCHSQHDYDCYPSPNSWKFCPECGAKVKEER